jgi:hypothetical protein
LKGGSAYGHKEDRFLPSMHEEVGALSTKDRHKDQKQ